MLEGARLLQNTNSGLIDCAAAPTPIGDYIIFGKNCQKSHARWLHVHVMQLKEKNSDIKLGHSNKLLNKTLCEKNFYFSPHHPEIS